MVPLISLLLGTAMAAVLTGTGRLVLRCFGRQGYRPEAVLALSLGLGAGLYSYVFFALSLMGILNAGIYAGLFIAAAAISLPGLWILRGDFRGLRFDFSTLKPRWLLVWLLVVLFACLAMALISSTAPISDYDSKEYHVGLVHRYVHDGKMQFYADSVGLSYFVARTMLNLWIMRLGPDSACQVLTWWFGIGLLAATYAIGRRFFTPAAGLVAAALVAAYALFAERSIQPTSDMTSMMMVALSVYLVLEGRDEKRLVSVVLAGMMAGLAVAFRMNALVFLLGFGVFALIWWRWGCRYGLSRILLHSAILFTACMACWAAWPLRNYLWTGNPLYPFLSSFFGGWAWNNQCGHIAHAQSPYQSLAQWFFQWPLKPFDFIRYGTLSLAFAPVALVFREHRRMTIFVAIPALLTIAITAYLDPDDRYFSFAMPLVSVLAGYGLTRALEWKGAFGRVLAVVAALTLAGDVAFAGLWHQQFIRGAIGLTPREEFLRNSSSFYDDFVWMNQNLPPDAKVLLVYREEYYLDRPVVRLSNEITPIDFRRYRNSDEFARALWAQGVTHFFYPDPTAPATAVYWSKLAWGSDGLQLLHDLARNNGVLIHHNPASVTAGRLFNRGTAATSVYRLVPPQDCSTNDEIKRRRAVYGFVWD
jgi:hypothetical protein